MGDRYDNITPPRRVSEAYKKSRSDVETLLRKIQNNEDLSNYFPKEGKCV